MCHWIATTGAVLLPRLQISKELPATADLKGTAQCFLRDCRSIVLLKTVVSIINWALKAFVFVHHPAVNDVVYDVICAFFLVKCSWSHEVLCFALPPFFLIWIWRRKRRRTRRSRRRRLSKRQRKPARGRSSVAPPLRWRRLVRCIRGVAPRLRWKKSARSRSGAAPRLR